MAKIVKVTYGTQGDTEEYAYLVNDNVRTGDYIHPSVVHYISHKVFGTTAIVQSTTKSTTQEGQAVINDLRARGKDVAKVLTGKEAGATASRDAQGHFIGGSGLRNTVFDKSLGESGRYRAPDDTEFAGSQYITQTRKANVAYREEQENERMKNVSHETFDSYSAKFTDKNKGE